jgi:hypothetical protein
MKSPDCGLSAMSIGRICAQRTKGEWGRADSRQDRGGHVEAHEVRIEAAHARGFDAQAR